MTKVGSSKSRLQVPASILTDCYGTEYEIRTREFHLGKVGVASSVSAGIAGLFRYALFVIQEIYRTLKANAFTSIFFESFEKSGSFDQYLSAYPDGWKP